jgi:hypothetical protein
MTDRHCLSTAREGYIGSTFPTRSIEEIRAIFGKVRITQRREASAPRRLTV